VELRWTVQILTLRTPFRTAHGGSDTRRNVIVSVEQQGQIGWGEAAGLSYHGESEAGILAHLQRAAPVLASVAEPLDSEAALDAVLDRLPEGSRAATAALDLALHDLWGRHQGLPLYRLLGLDPGQAPNTSFTVGLDTPDAMARRAAASGLPLLKLKLGGDDDEAIVAAVRDACPDATLRVDANAGWSRERAAALIPHLARHGLEFVEQPLAADDVDGLRRLRGLGLGVPIYADESVRTADDVTRLAGAVDGVVIKLMKCGGLRAARRAIAAARAGGMRVMIGCMIESSVGVTAAAHLAPLCDEADLDGPLLVTDDPFRGVGYSGARLRLPDGPGLGVTPRVTPRNVDFMA